MQKARRPKKFISLLFYSLVIIGSVFAISKWLSKPVEAAWYDDSWQYRTKIVITNTGAAVTNQKVKFDIATDSLVTAGKIQSDCGDSRFVSSTGEILRYYLDSAGGACNTASTDYYVLLPNIDAGSVVLYHYYGNPGIVNGTEGANFAATTFSPNSNSSATEEKTTAPLAYWKFDESSGTTVGDSTGRYNGTIGGTSVRQPKETCISNGCMYMDGSSGYMSTNLPASPASLTEVTFMGWMRPTDNLSGYHSFMSTDDGGYDRSVGVNAATFNVQVGDQGWTPSPSVDIGKWQHIAVVYSASQITFYKNGVPYYYGSGGSFGSTSQTFELGRDLACGSCYFRGFLDDVRVYGYALTSTQVNQVYKSPGDYKPAKAQLSKTNNETINPSSLTDGMIADWRMDETSGNLSDNSGNGITGTVAGTATVVAGKYGYARDLDGTSNYITAADSTTLDLPVTANRITISAWINWDGNVVTDGKYILRKLTASGFGSAPWGVYDIGIANGSNNMFFRISDGINGGSEAIIGGATTLSTGVWYFLTATYDGTTMRVYVNGVQDGSGSSSIAMGNTAHPLIIGKDTISSTGNNFNGKLDEIRLYNRALSASEVTSLYQFRPLPQVYWNLDEGAGTTANDLQGYSGTAIVNSWTTGKYGKALNMNGTSQYLRNSSVVFNPAYAFTLEFWVYDTNDSGTIVWGEISTGTTCNNNPQVWKDGSNNITLGRCGNGAGPNVGASSSFLNGWHHVAFVYDGTTTYGYKDGTFVNSYTYTWPSFTTSRFTIGGSREDTPASYLTGKLDEVRLYNYARTQKEIVSDMNGNHSNVGSPVASAVGQWHFDEGADNTCVGGSNDVCNSGNSSTNIDGAVSGTAVPATSTSGWTSSGKFGRAMNFDGTNDYISVGTQSSLDVIGGDFTVSSWVKTAQTGSTKWILQKGSGNLIASDKGYSLYLGTSGSKWSFGVWDGTTGHDITPSTTQGVDTTNWHHLVGVFVASTKTAYLYVDGKLASQATNSSYSTPSISANNFNIGATGAAGSSWSGGIDEVKVYNYALSSDEVKLDYNRGSSLVLGTEDTGAKMTGGAGSTPLAYWDLNEKTGLTAFEKSGTGINGTLEGGAKWTTGKFGSGIYFDGVDDRVNMGDVTTFDSQTGLSISLWTKISTLATARRMVSKWTSSQSTFMISLDDTNSDELIMAVSDGAHYDVFSTTAANLTTDRWYHIEMTWTDTTRAIYVNGVSMTLSTTLDQGITGTNNSTEPLQIGDSGETTPFNGFIDDVKIYNYARSQSLVAFDYNHGAPAGLWQMDECQGSTVYDSSPNANGGFNGNNGTYTIGGTGTYTSLGSCNSGTSTEAWNGGTTGKLNSSIGLDGTNDYVEIPYTSNLAPTIGISFGGWFYTTDKTQVSQSILSKTQGGGYNLFLNNNGGACGSSTSLCGLVNVNSSYYPVDYAIGNLSNNTWYHAMVTFNGSIVKLYVNGSLVDSKPASGAVTYTFNNALCIGAEPGNTVCDAGSPFKGKLDDIRVYNYEVSATQIKEIYNNGGIYFGPSSGTP